MNLDANKRSNRAPSAMDGKSLERKPWMSTLEGRLVKADSNLNSRRRQLVREILLTAQNTYFLSSRELEKRYDVDTATIVRTIQVLGYERYAEFLADLRSHFVNRITPY